MAFMRRMKTRSQKGRRSVRKTRRQRQRKSQRRHNKQRGGNIFFDANKTPEDSVVAGGINPDIDGGTGIFRVRSDMEDALEGADIAASQGI